MRFALCMSDTVCSAHSEQDARLADVYAILATILVKEIRSGVYKFRKRGRHQIDVIMCCRSDSDRVG